MINFRYDLPWDDRILMVQSSRGTAAMRGPQLNAMLTETASPISIALRLLNLRRGEKQRLTYKNEAIGFKRTK